MSEKKERRRKKAVREEPEGMVEAEPQINTDIASSGVLKAIIKLLNILLTSTAKKHNISARLIATKDDLEEISSGNKENRVLKGWRYEIFGSIALKLMQGDISIKIKNGTIIID